jgi:CRISPR-associated protein Csh2
MEEIIKNRREYLFLYDVSFANPNGDPNDENKPRIDEETGKNIVTDVRLKRTIRDYLKEFEELEIFVREIVDEEGKIQDAKARAKDFDNNPEKILNECIDVRLFGGTIPITTGKSKDSSITCTGAVQFGMGQSLHRVKLEFIKGTGAFASTSGKEQKTFREEWILPYSFIAFHGIANQNAAKITKLTDKDLELLKKAMWEGTKNLITRSKNQMPRLLLEVIYKEGINSHIGELHRYIKIKSEKTDEELRSTDDFILNVDKLLEVLEEEAEKIEKVLCKKDRNLKLSRDLSSDKIQFEEISF